MFNGLRFRLTLIFVTLTILPLLLVGGLVASRAFETLQNEAVNFQQQLAREASVDLRGFFNERVNELSVLIDVYGIDTLTLNSQRDILLALLAKQPAYYRLSLIDPTGQESLRLTRGEIVTNDDLIDRGEDPLFRSVLETGVTGFSSVYFDEDARDRLINVGLPVTDLFTGELTHVLVAEIRFQTVTEQVLRNLTLRQNEEVYILDPNGVVIAHRNPSLVLSEVTYTVPTANGRQAGLDGSDVILAKNIVPLANFELIVIAETRYADAIALASDLINIATVITLVTLVITGAIIVFLVSRITTPITRLSNVARAIQGGDFSQQVTVDRKDEIGQFAAAFNSMTSAIQKRESDLRKQADELRIATAKAKEAARVKGEFLANVSHELRTPLNAIIGFSDMLLAGMSGPLNEKQTHKLTRLKDNGARLLSLINDLLDLTRIESGRLETVDKEFSPRTLAERMTAQMESLAVASSLKFEMTVAPDMPEKVWGDEKRVEQVIVNLLSNAFKFTKEGSVSLRIDANRAERTWTVDVTDTGVGIPPHAVNVIFEEFRQLDGSYSRAYKGTGLGLSITRNLVRMMGGKITVKSAVGTGSTFTVTLPLHTEKTEASTDMAAAAVEG